MNIEQYYKEIALSFKKKNEEMKNNPEKLDALYLAFEKEYGTSNLQNK